MNKKYFGIIVVTVLLFWVTPGFGQDYFYSSEMSVEKYNTELKTWQTRIVQLEQQKQQLRKEIENLKENISDAKEEIARTRHETLLLLSAIVSYPDKIQENKDHSPRVESEKTKYQYRSF